MSSAASASDTGRRVVQMFGLTIDCLTLPETLDRIDYFIRDGRVHQYVAVNVDKVAKADRDPELSAIVNAADLVTADGQPIVWASHLLGHPLPERVTGIDLMVALLARSDRAGYRVYFLGATATTLNRVVARVQSDHPGLNVAGSRDGYWPEGDDEAVARAIAATRPEILLVALPSPRKERFLSQWKELIGAQFVMGVGGSFDVYAGLVQRAPRLVQRIGAEWLFRLLQEPRRMWRRYLVDDLRFLAILVREMRNRR